jgi:hypothetical protein
MEDMIMAVKAPGLFYGQKVSRLLNHTDHGPVSPLIRTDDTGVVFRKGKTAGTELNCIVQFRQGGGQLPGVCPGTTQDIHGQPGCRFIANPGQTAQIPNQAVKGWRNDLHAKIPC